MRSLRIEAGLSQQGLALKAKVHRVTIADLERGAHSADTLTLEKLAKALRVSVAALLDVA